MAKKKAPSLPLYRNIAVSFSALTILLIVIMLYFSVVRATIIVTPRIQNFPLTAAVSVVREPTAGATALVGAVFTQDVTKRGTFPTAVVREESAKASGAVRITNATGNPQTLVATTRFLTPEKILFRLKDTVVAPARGTVVGTLVAESAGAAGDVGTTRFVIPGLRSELQEKIYGESVLPIAGGRRSVRRLTQQDLDDARATLAKQMEEGVRSALARDAGGEPSILLTMTPTASTLDQKLGAAVDTFSLTLTARAQGVAVAEKALHDWIATQMKTALPDDQRLLPFTLDAFAIRVTNLDATAGTARLLVQGEGKSLPRGASPVFDRRRFIGRLPNEVETLLKQHGGVADVFVRLSPFFAKRLPRLPDHIRVDIREP